MSLEPLKPGDLPTLQSRAQRRQWDANDARDAERQMGRRENVDPQKPTGWTVCRDSKFGKHRFVASGGKVCEFCGEPWRACVVTT